MEVYKATSYGFGNAVPGPFDHAVELVKDAFKAEGFGVVTEMNVQKTLKEKIGEEMEPYLVLGMCNPNLASRAIAAEHEIGLMLPCSVLIHECGGEVHVLAQDPEMIAQISNNSDLGPIAYEARQRIKRAMHRLLA